MAMGETVEMSNPSNPQTKKQTILPIPRAREWYNASWHKSDGRGSTMLNRKIAIGHAVRAFSRADWFTRFVIQRTQFVRSEWLDVKECTRGRLR